MPVSERSSDYRCNACGSTMDADPGRVCPVCDRDHTVRRNYEAEIDRLSATLREIEAWRGADAGATHAADMAAKALAGEAEHDGIAWDAFLAGYDEGWESRGDDHYWAKPFLRERFRRWLAERNAS